MRTWMQDSEVSSQNWQETYVCNCVLWSTGDYTMEARFKCVLFFQDMEISAVELQTIMNKIVGKRRCLFHTGAQAFPLFTLALPVSSPQEVTSKPMASAWRPAGSWST